ncbi:MAG: DHH family phosphoesterase [Spirochaetota bacterium]
MKQRIPTIAERNRIIERIITALDQRSGFLVVGHTNPDEDCLSSMVGFALIAKKFAKTVSVLLEGPVHDNFDYLLRICRYNSIEIAYSLSEDLEYDTIVVCDTAKPALLAKCDGLLEAIHDPQSLTIEIDHHLETDSEYHADRKYALVDQATSSCELVGVLGYKLAVHDTFVADRQIPEIFTRNVVLSILTGVVGDTQMGKFVQNRKERRMYNAFTQIFGAMLFEKTSEQSSNVASINQLFQELKKLSKQEEECFDAVYRKRRSSSLVSYVVMDQAEYDELLRSYGEESVSTVLRTIADSLAEDSGYVSLVAYSATGEKAGVLQCRARRSKHYKGLDLRSVLEKFNVQNGGGHAGAIGFRFTIAELPCPPDEYVKKLVDGLNEMMYSLEGSQA